MRQLITKITTQILTVLLLFTSTTFWLGIIDRRTIIPYFIILFTFLLITQGLSLFIFLSAIVLSIIITLPLISHLNVLPGVRALIVATIFGVSLCIATLFAVYKETNKKNRENHNHSK